MSTPPEPPSPDASRPGAGDGPDAPLDDRIVARLGEMVVQYDDLRAQLGDPDVVADHRAVTRIATRAKALEPVVTAWRGWLALQDEIASCQEVLAMDDGSDADVAELAEVAAAELETLARTSAERVAEVQRLLVQSDDAAVGAVILEIRAGVGGDEAGLWAGDLLKMYESFAARRGWRLEVLDTSPAEIGGFKSVMARVAGDGAWSGLGYEGGTHQVKRVPATEAQGRVHTSTATVAVLPEVEDVDVALDRSDVKEMITTAQGPGGQNVNKVATAVHLIHEPTGISVRMQDTKSQAQNREKAWAILRARLADQQKRERDAERAEQRAAMIGTGNRAEKIRTYRWKENVVVDHRVKASANLSDVMAGGLDALVEPLVAEDTARRLAAI